VVTFRLFAAARAAAGRAEVQVPAGPIADTVAALLAQGPPRLGEVVSISSLVCDGRRLDPGSTEPLPDGAVVDVLPPFAGG
jgi:molybdopterin converting factor small subunit